MMKELVAGREFDALLATKIMGWYDLRGNTMYHLTPDGTWSDKTYDGFHFGPDKTWSPSTNIVAALEVWLKIKELPSAERWILDITKDRTRIIWDDERKYEVSEADTAPLAICLAALKAIDAAV